jgi:peptide/nickel transport system permease protein
VIRQAVGITSIVVLVVIVVACSIPGAFTPYAPNGINFEEKLLGPNPRHPMGTDEMGRDLLARVLYGGRVTIWSSLIIAGGSILIATLWACTSAYTGGMVDEMMTRLVDTLMNIPSLLLVLLLVSLLEPGMLSLVISLTLIKWTGYARVIRGQVYGLLNAEFLLAARAIGADSPHILRKHIIPNTWLLIVTLFGLSIGSSMLSISSLSFLGFGVRLPHPEWGAMINYARPFLQTRPHLMLFPGLAIILTILATNLSVNYLDRRNQKGLVSYL